MKLGISFQQSFQNKRIRTLTCQVICIVPYDKGLAVTMTGLLDGTSGRRAGATSSVKRAELGPCLLSLLV